MITVQQLTRKELEKKWIDISDREYEGYIWMSDAVHPIVIKKAKLGDWEQYHKPGKYHFITEVNLYNESISINIVFHDGIWTLKKINWQRVLLEGLEILEHEYISSVITPGKFTILHYKEAWLPVEDPYCQNMEVLEPAWIAFTGFKEEQIK